MIKFKLNDKCKVVSIDHNLDIKETILLEKVEGDIFKTLYEKVEEINCERLQKHRREVNSIAISPILYQYLKFLAFQRMSFVKDDVKSAAAQIFGLKIVIRDDYNIDQIDIYRDVTGECY